MASVIERQRRPTSRSRKGPRRSPAVRTEAPPFPIYQISVAQYRQMAEVGVLTDDDRVELLEGWIVPKVTHNPPHDWTANHVGDLVRDTAGQRVTVRVQSAINTSDSEPEPDVAVAKGPKTRYVKRHPGPRDLLLVVEVADTTVTRDRLKAGLYAAASIPVYWIVNLPERQIEVHARPAPRKREYRDVTIFSSGDDIPVIIDGREIGRLAVNELLPPQS